MGTYYIPRNYKGETRILVIFSVKSLVTTLIGLIVGLFFFLPLNGVGLTKIGVVFLIIFGLIGYGIGAIKIPTIVGLPVTKKIGGEPLSDIIIRYFNFRRNRKIYTYIDTDTKKEEK